MNIILALWLCLVIFMPFIICGILVTIIICVIRTKAISKTFKILIIIIILLLVCILLSIIKDEKTDNLYIEMKEISDNQSLVGLNKEQIATLLGEPMKKYTKEDRWVYNAGTVYEGLFLGNHTIYAESKWYVLLIAFDETDKVTSTKVQYFP